MRQQLLKDPDYGRTHYKYEALRLKKKEKRSKSNAQQQSQITGEQYDVKYHALDGYEKFHHDLHLITGGVISQRC